MIPVACHRHLQPVCQDVANLDALSSLSQKRADPSHSDIRQCQCHQLGDQHVMVNIVNASGEVKAMCTGSPLLTAT